jgi:ribonucleotide reductase alpha subunit
MERSIGVGALGFHAFLQKNNIPFEGALAKSAKIRMFKHIREQLDVANKQLGSERGEAPDVQSPIKFTGDSGRIITINSSDFVNVIRNNTQLLIRAYDVIEGDEIVLKDGKL